MTDGGQWATKFATHAGAHLAELGIDTTDIALTNKGSILCKLGRHKEEILCCEKAVKINSKNYIAWFNYGIELIKKGSLSEGIKCINRAMKVEPKFAGEGSLFYKTHALIRQKKYKAAKLCLKKFTRVAKKDANTYYSLACIYSLLKNTNKALRMLKKTLMLNKSFKITARKDPDFTDIKTNETFKKLVN